MAEKAPSYGDRVRVEAPFEASKTHAPSHTRRVRAIRANKGTHNRRFNGTIIGLPDEMRQLDLQGITVIHADGKVDTLMFDNYTVALDDGSVTAVSKKQLEVL